MKAILLVLLLGVAFSQAAYPISNTVRAGFQIYEDYINGQLDGIGSGANITLQNCSAGFQDLARDFDDILNKYKENYKLPILFALRKGGAIADKIEALKGRCLSDVELLITIAGHSYRNFQKSIISPEAKFSAIMMNIVMYGQEHHRDILGMIQAWKDRSPYKYGKHYAHIYKNLMTLHPALRK